MDVFDDLGAGVGPSDSGVCDGSTDFMTRINQQGSSLFRSNECLSSIPQSLHPNSTRLRAVATELMLRGAKLSPNLDQKVTHVLVDFDNNYSVEREVALQVRQSGLVVSYIVVISVCVLIYHGDIYMVGVWRRTASVSCGYKTIIASKRGL